MSRYGEINSAIELYLGKLGDAIASDAQQACPVDTGALADSITSSVHGQTLTVGSDVSYAADVEFGTSPHLIEGNPYLAFFWEKIGQDVVFRHVHHPGTPEQPFLRPALYRERGEL